MQSERVPGMREAMRFVWQNATLSVSQLISDCFPYREL